MIWIKNQAGNLVNLTNVQLISVQEEKPGEWWIHVEAVYHWWNRAFPGPYATKEDAERDLKRIEEIIRLGPVQPVLLDLNKLYL